MYGIYTRHTAKPGQRDALIASMLRASEQMESIPECLHFVINKAEEPDVIWATVVWTSKEDHDAVLQRADVRAAIADSIQYLSPDTPPQQIFLTPVGGKGLAVEK
jgi:quinol monooxygenase YgiN